MELHRWIQQLKIIAAQLDMVQLNTQERSLYLKCGYSTSPPEIPNSVVTQVLNRYGTLSSIRNEQWSTAFPFPVNNGIRAVKMEIKQRIPGSVKIAGFPAQITYVGQPQLCFVCQEPGHLKEECPKRKTKLNVSVQPRKLLLSDIVAGIAECSAPASHVAEHTESTLTTEQIHDEQPDPMELEERHPAPPAPVIKFVEKSNDVNYLKATEDFVEQIPEEQDNKAEHKDMEDKIQHQEKHPAEEDTTMSVDCKAQEQQVDATPNKKLESTVEHEIIRNSRLRKREIANSSNIVEKESQNISTIGKIKNKPQPHPYEIYGRTKEGTKKENAVETGSSQEITLP
ncbi:hypothetical protein ANN_13139 [Periplaneta americana]|uniref:CCHC-type domain-containing protein n=1 Tax=Periplaneta americana TaxID=6978 RepID=A0ABQ8TIK4_PERAM|nr:hypothetical protein ANN_13139 [Periplaneta americana]